MNVDELRQKAKAAGIKSWHLKKPESLKQELAELEETPIDEQKEPESEPEQPINEQDQPDDETEQEETPDEAIEEPEEGLKIIVNTVDLKFFKSIGLKPEWLVELANKYGFNKFQYMAKFKAFRCFIDDKNVDWVDVNDLSLLNGGVKITEIRLRHQPLSVDRQVIKLPWRDSTKLKINDPSMR